MRKSGCGFNGGTCQPIVENCGECKNTLSLNENIYCKSYMSPKASWIHLGGCAMNTVKVVKVEETKVMNSIKASKKSVGAKGKKK
jgi:hypothetical protein